MRYSPFPLFAGLGSLVLGQDTSNNIVGWEPGSCPSLCDRLGTDPINWTYLHSLENLQQCTEPLLFDLNIHNSVADSETLITIRACSQEDQAQSLRPSSSSAARRDISTDSLPDVELTLPSDPNCGASVERKQVSARVRGTTDGGSDLLSSDVFDAAGLIISYLENGAGCGTTIMFAKSGSVIIGVYSGAEVSKNSSAKLMKSFQNQTQKGASAFEICTGLNTAAQTFGVFTGRMTDIDRVQNAVKTWSNSKCAEQEDMIPLDGIEVDVLVSSIKVSNNRTDLHARDTCRDIQVISGDSCASLASRCGITAADFAKDNPSSNLCSNLKPKQYVCCSAGALPDHSPQPGSDGSCYTYTVKTDDGCWSIADSFGISQTVIENNNKNTWGWAGCNHLQPGQKICLSKGDPPFPSPVENAVCGPQVPGTKKPAAGTSFATLNPCPLNACCDAWGWCGVTAEFCTATPADTGAPGTARPGTNGCISNCGTKITNNANAPASFRRVGYFEAWNANRKCLHMDVTQIDTSMLTHIHFAFATVTKDWGVSVEDVKEQFQKFKGMKTSVKKIISFGGWDFSTGGDTFQLFRDAAKPENREKFANNVINFLTESGLDGVDFDWEYPGAPDIPDIPPGSKQDAMNYLSLLSLIKGKLPAGKSLSIALPASFWYLKSYPVTWMQYLVDYFIYMTYDLHGQWDVDNKNASPGCPRGNCLRSHVNITETTTALAMITKAGVEANKVVIGITSYGRSFRMSDPNCIGPMCTYTGTNKSSNAYKGRCTNTAGYISNAEMKEIIDGKNKDYNLVKSTYDSASDSNILVFGTPTKADWVAYMDETTKTSRSGWVKSLNFGGTSDWAVDLMNFVDGDSGEGNGRCDPNDRTYSKDSMPKGSYMRWGLMDAESAGATGKQYITVVNLTPHRFKLDHTHSYQMDEFDFGDIPPGRARQNIVHYTESTGNPKDDNGEAYYNIEGTAKKFVARATTHIPDDHGYISRIVFDLSGMGLGQREYKAPEQEVPVTLVITGSESYGFMASLTHGPGNWMHHMYDTIKDRPLRNLVMPGSHDAGMSTISHHLLTAANAGDTQTQGVNIYNQLRAGARWFDLRVASIHQVTPNEGVYEFYATHVGDENAEVALGNTGESLKDIIVEINKFTAENPGEVILFKVKYLVGIRKVPSFGSIKWTRKIMDDFLDILKGLNNRCANMDLNTQFNQQPVKYFMDRNNGAGCVIFLLDISNLPKDINGPYHNDGIYNLSMLNFKDNWSNLGSTEDMANDQIKNWQAIKRTGIDAKGDSTFLVSQWMVTPDILTTEQYGVQNMAIKPTNPSLYWAGVNAMSPESWPNAIQIDYIGVVVKDEFGWDSLSAELYTLCVGMNLYMLSENCDIGVRRSPLLPSTKMTANTRLNLLSAPQWNGIIFANGTKLDNPSPTLHPGRVEILRNGTIFSNGTVLTTDVRNPDYGSISF